MGWNSHTMSTIPKVTRFRPNLSLSNLNSDHSVTTVRKDPYKNIAHTKVSFQKSLTQQLAIAMQLNPPHAATNTTKKKFQSLIPVTTAKMPTGLMTSHEVRVRHIGGLLRRQMNWLPDRMPALWLLTLQSIARLPLLTASYSDLSYSAT